MRLAGKTALVTGGANGIGAAIGRRFRAEGAHLAIVDRLAPDLAAFRAIEGPGAVEPYACEVTDPAAVADTCAAVLARFGRVDILVNNAGGSGDILARTIEETTDEVWSRVMDANLTAILRFTRPLLPGMRANRWGRIINMSSRVRHGVPGPFPTMKSHIAYVVAKGAMVSLTAQFGKEGGPDGVTCNAIAPALVLPGETARVTTMFRAADPEFQRQFIARIPLGRAGTGEDIAGIAAFLASADSEFINGQTIDATGG